MKKFLLFLAAATMSFGIVACGGGASNNSNDNNVSNDSSNDSDSNDESETADTEEIEPEEKAVIGFLDAVKEADFAKINSYVTEDDLMYEEDTTQDNSEEKIVFENMTYNITSLVSVDTSDTNDQGKATVGVEIGNVDMHAVLKTYQELIEQSSDMTQEKAVALLKQAVDENKDTNGKQEVKIDVVQIDGEWKVQTTEELLSALTGGMSEMEGFSIEQ